MKSLYWNCCGGLSGKYNSVKLVINQENPDMFFVAEAEYRTDQTWLNIDGYQLITTKTNKYGKVRLVCFVKKDAGFKQVESEHIKDDLEMLIIENKYQRCVGIYRPFKMVNSNTRSSYFKKMIESLTWSKQTTKKLSVCGDFNINWNLESPEKEILETWAIDAGVIQLIQDNTWSRIVTIDENSTLRTSKLDLVFTNDEDLRASVGDPITSDHCLITMQTIPVDDVVVRTKIKRRNWKRYNPQNFNENFMENWNFPWTNDIETNVNGLTNALQTQLDYFCPWRVIRLNRETDLVDQKLEALKKKRKRLRRSFNKEKDPRRKLKIGIDIQQLAKSIKIRINTAAREQIHIKLNGTNPRSFWHTISKLEGKKSFDKIELEINGTLETSPYLIAEELATFFETKVSTLLNNYGKLDYGIGPSNLSFTIEEIVKAAKLLKSKLCTGEDGLPMRIVRDFTITNPWLLQPL